MSEHDGRDLLASDRGFPPVVQPTVRVLILGSMPGRASLDASQYYAHPRNAFWPIIEFGLGIPASDPYPNRLRALAESDVALWDVCDRCVREGSLDSAIDRRSVVPNDFDTLFEHCPKIETVFFNGQAAEQLFRRSVLSRPNRSSAQSDRMNRIRFVRLPSTSPAHASRSLEQKREAWSVVFEVLREGSS